MLRNFRLRDPMHPGPSFLSEILDEIHRRTWSDGPMMLNSRRRVAFPVGNSSIWVVIKMSISYLKQSIARFALGSILKNWGHFLEIVNREEFLKTRYTRHFFVIKHCWKCDSLRLNIMLVCCCNSLSIASITSNANLHFIIRIAGKTNSN